MSIINAEQFESYQENIMVLNITTLLPTVSLNMTNYNRGVLSSANFRIKHASDNQKKYIFKMLQLIADHNNVNVNVSENYYSIKITHPNVRNPSELLQNGSTVQIVIPMQRSNALYSRNIDASVQIYQTNSIQCFYDYIIDMSHRANQNHDEKLQLFISCMNDDMQEIVDCEDCEDCEGSESCEYVY